MPQRSSCASYWFEIVAVVNDRISSATSVSTYSKPFLISRWSRAWCQVLHELARTCKIERSESRHTVWLSYTSWKIGSQENGGRWSMTFVGSRLYPCARSMIWLGPPRCVVVDGPYSSSSPRAASISYQPMSLIGDTFICMQKKSRSDMPYWFPHKKRWVSLFICSRILVEFDVTQLPRPTVKGSFWIYEQLLTFLGTNDIPSVRILTMLHRFVLLKYALSWFNAQLYSWPYHIGAYHAAAPQACGYLTWMT